MAPPSWVVGYIAFLGCSFAMLPYIVEAILKCVCEDVSGLASSLWCFRNTKLQAVAFGDLRLSFDGALRNKEAHDTLVLLKDYIHLVVERIGRFLMERTNSTQKGNDPLR